MTGLTPQQGTNQPPRGAPKAGGRATMKQVAALAGVGIKTVSRVVNSEPNVSAATTEKVWQAINALDYQVDMRAGSLRRADGRTRTVGLLVSAVENPFAGEMHRGVEEVARARGVVVLAASLDEDPSRELAFLRDLHARHVDGLLLDTTTNDPEHLDRVLSFKIPVVFVDREPTRADIDTVTSDNREAAAMATRHLIEHGHRRIAFIMERPEILTAAHRHAGFLDALAEAGIPLEDCPILQVGKGVDASETAMKEFLAKEPLPTAIFSSQNLLTIGAIRALRAANLHKRIAFVGFDDIPFSEFLDPPLTVVRQDPRQIGQVAASRLFARLDGEEFPHEHLKIPSALIPRGSGEIPAPR